MIRSRSFFNDIVKREEATPYSVVSLSEAEKGEIKEGKNKEIEGMNRLLFVDISNEVVVPVEGEYLGNPLIYVRRKSNFLNVSQPSKF